jgi:hypothetical protein
MPRLPGDTSPSPPVAKRPRSSSGTNASKNLSKSAEAVPVPDLESCSFKIDDLPQVGLPTVNGAIAGHLMRSCTQLTLRIILTCYFALIRHRQISPPF